jgi:hypothetical protein
VIAIPHDDVRQFSGHYYSQKCPHELPALQCESQYIILLLSNHSILGSTAVAAVSQDRWQIENTFKTIQSNLEIKTFVVTTVNPFKFSAGRLALPECT